MSLALQRPHREELVRPRNYLTRFNKIAIQRINSKWQVDKETLWLIDSLAYQAKGFPCPPAIWS